MWRNLQKYYDHNDSESKNIITDILLFHLDRCSTILEAFNR